MVNPKTSFGLGIFIFIEIPEQKYVWGFFVNGLPFMRRSQPVTISSAEQF